MSLLWFVIVMYTENVNGPKHEWKGVVAQSEIHNSGNAEPKKHFIVLGQGFTMGSLS